MTKVPTSLAGLRRSIRWQRESDFTGRCRGFKQRIELTDRSFRCDLHRPRTKLASQSRLPAMETLHALEQQLEQE
ncbi:hypothetical protein OK016_28230 [Vibrio chagasii]|nr:hypothetical protein [Vibrio chagasii]